MSSSESSEHEESLHSRSISESENGDSSEVDIVVSGIKTYENEPLPVRAMRTTTLSSTKMVCPRPFFVRDSMAKWP